MPPKNARPKAQLARWAKKKLQWELDASKEFSSHETIDFEGQASNSFDSEEDDIYCSDDSSLSDDEEEDNNNFDNLTIPIDNISVYWLSIRNSQKMLQELEEARKEVKDNGSFTSKEGFKYEYNESGTRIKLSKD